MDVARPSARVSHHTGLGLPPTQPDCPRVSTSSACPRVPAGTIMSFPETAQLDLRPATSIVNDSFSSVVKHVYFSQPPCDRLGMLPSPVDGASFICVKRTVLLDWAARLDDSIGDMREPMSSWIELAVQADDALLGGSEPYQWVGVKDRETPHPLGHANKSLVLPARLNMSDFAPRKQVLADTTVWPPAPPASPRPYLVESSEVESSETCSAIYHLPSWLSEAVTPVKDGSATPAPTATASPSSSSSASPWTSVATSLNASPPPEKVSESSDWMSSKRALIVAATEDLECPITLEPFKDPVVADDGITYERYAIAAWQERTGTSPTTDAPIGSRFLPNILLRKLIEA